MKYIRVSHYIKTMDKYSEEHQSSRHNWKFYGKWLVSRSHVDATWHAKALCFQYPIWPPPFTAVIVMCRKSFIATKDEFVTVKWRSIAVITMSMRWLVTLSVVWCWVFNSKQLIRAVTMTWNSKVAARDPKQWVERY